LRREKKFHMVVLDPHPLPQTTRDLRQPFSLAASRPAASRTREGRRLG
jgi:hypothetical protein